MANIIGIDLGTTYSAVSRLDPSGRAEIIRDKDGNNLTPSVVLFEDSNHTLIGWEAHRDAEVTPQKVAKEFKREMGSEQSFGPHSLTPTDLSALVLKKLKQIAESTGDSIDAAVITVPANFSNSARVATMESGKRAGLPVANIVNEPTAAALYYAFVEGVSGKMAVYDLGGGTFDVSIVDVSGTNVEVLSSQGNQRLGGTDFDRCLLELIDQKYRQKSGTEHAIVPSDLRARTVEELKKSLSNRQSVLVAVEPPDKPKENIEITRDEFSEKIGTLITKAEMLFEAALDEAGLSSSDLDHIVLVGGSTRVPSVRQSVERMAGRPAISSKNVDEVVSLGAALYAGLKAGDISLTEAQKSAISHLTLNEICNHFYGTIILGTDAEKEQHVERVAILIRKNSKIPVSVTETYYTVADGQENVSCTVTQSVTEETDPRWVTKVSETNLGPLPPGRPAGQAIRVSYSYDSNQVMQCRFEDVQTGMTREVDIDLRSSGSGDAVNDIDKFLVE